MNIELERAAFEDCFKSLGIGPYQPHNNMYVADEIQVRWEAWQARAALQSQNYSNILRTLEECRDIAMEWTMRGRIPECGKFGEIAQNLDAVCAEEFRAALQSQDREDAERYRALRAGMLRWDDVMPTRMAEYAETHFIDIDNPTTAEIDAAVDHARRVEGDT